MEAELLQILREAGGGSGKAGEDPPIRQPQILLHLIQGTDPALPHAHEGEPAGVPDLVGEIPPGGE